MFNCDQDSKTIIKTQYENEMINYQFNSISILFISKDRESCMSTTRTLEHKFFIGVHNHINGP